MALRDVLAGEAADASQAAEAAAHGRSLTGFSGRRSDVEDRFATPGQVFGGTAEPIAGERVAKMQVRSIGGDSDIGDLIAGDPLFRERPTGTFDRKPFGDQEQALYYPPRSGFRRYWFNDIPGRIARAKQAGYSHVIDPDTNQPLARITDKDNGRGRASYLMEIPIEWYQQDMAKNAAKLEDRLNDIRKGQNGSDINVENGYAKISITGR